MEPDLVRGEPRHYEPASSWTFTRWPTIPSIPRSSGLSVRLDSRPIRPSFSERSVSRCLGLAPLVERICLMTNIINPPLPREHQPPTQLGLNHFRPVHLEPLWLRSSRSSGRSSGCRAPG